MRRMVCKSHGDSLMLETHAPAPPLPDDGVRIAVHAAGVNFADTLMMAGTYQDKPRLPLTPGFEVAGTVLECGPAVAGLTPGLSPGTRVLAMLDHGGYADEAVAHARDVLPLPDAMSFETAAVFPIVYGTAHFGLCQRAGLREGERVLITGAAGGVGLTAVEVARRLGAVVVAAARGPDKLAVCRAHGATHLVDYRDAGLRDQVKTLTDGEGVDVVYEAVGGDLFDAALRSTAAGARVLVVGFAGGNVPKIPANYLLVKNLTVMGYSFPAFRRSQPEAVRASLEELLGWWEEGALKPHVWARYPLEEAMDALAAIRTRQVAGKVVLLPRG